MPGKVSIFATKCRVFGAKMIMHFPYVIALHYIIVIFKRAICSEFMTLFDKKLYQETLSVQNSTPWIHFFGPKTEFAHACRHSDSMDVKLPSPTLSNQVFLTLGVLRLTQHSFFLHKEGGSAEVSILNEAAKFNPLL
jgi:hypothetical protein